MNFIKEKLVSGFDSVFIRLLIKRFRILENEEKPKTVCPDLNLLAAYLGDDLTADQRRKLEGHMVECRLCRKTVVNAFKSLESVPDPVLPRVKKS